MFNIHAKSHFSRYSLQFLEALKAGSNVVSTRVEVLEVADPVALPGGVQAAHGQRRPDVLGHLVQEGFHGGHLPLVHHEPAAAVEGVSVPVDHHALHGGQEARGSRRAVCHLRDGDGGGGGGGGGGPDASANTGSRKSSGKAIL